MSGLGGREAREHRPLVAGILGCLSPTEACVAFLDLSCPATKCDGSATGGVRQSYGLPPSDQGNEQISGIWFICKSKSHHGVIQE